MGLQSIVKGPDLVLFAGAKFVGHIFSGEALNPKP
jgi:hypothetical protein